MDSGQTLYIVSLQSWWDFGETWHNFQGHHSLKTKSQHFRALPYEPVGGFWLHMHIYIDGKGKRVYYVLVTLTLFSRSHQHFETWNSDQIKVSALYLLNGIIDPGQTLNIVSIDIMQSWLDFGDPKFPGHHAIKTVKTRLFCALSSEPDSGFKLNLYRYIFGKAERVDEILVPLTLLTRSHVTLSCQILTKIMFLNQMMDSIHTFCIISLWYNNVGQHDSHNLRLGVWWVGYIFLNENTALIILAVATQHHKLLCLVLVQPRKTSQYGLKCFLGNPITKHITITPTSDKFALWYR